MTGEALLSGTELADFLGVPVRTVDGWRHRGGGPRFVKVGRHVRYRPADVNRWLTANTHDRTEAA
jgi:excisionase family DNA binding protein